MYPNFLCSLPFETQTDDITDPINDETSLYFQEN